MTKDAVIISLKPKWWEKMLSGQKPLEIRKTFPKKIKFPFRVYVHVSGTKGIAGVFICRAKIRTNYYKYLALQSCVPEKELRDYGAGNNLYGWVITAPVEFKKPLQLADIGVKAYPQSWCYCEDIGGF